MLGHIVINKGELKVKEYEMYKAVYCTLCKKIKKEYGFFATLTISYDFTFLSLLCMSQKQGFGGCTKKHCIYNPFKKCTFCNESEDFSLPAAATVLTVYAKLLDDIEDEKGFKKLRALFLRPLYKGAYKKARKNYPQLAKRVEDYLTAQSKAEQDKNCSLDGAAFPTSDMLSYIFLLCAENENSMPLLSRFGFLLGRYIYLIDVLADYEKDMKSGAFNPLSNEDFSTAKEHIKEQCYIIINETIDVFEKLEIKKFKDIIGNIVYNGLEDTLQKELNR